MNWVTFDQRFNDAITEIPEITRSCVATLSLCVHQMFRLFLYYHVFLKFPPNISCGLFVLGFFWRACHRARCLSVPDYCTRFFTLCPSPFLKIVNLGTGRKIEVIKYYFAFKADVFVLWFFFFLPPFVVRKRQEPALLISSTTVCNHCVVCSVHAVVIFHNHRTLLHPSPPCIYH